LKKPKWIKRKNVGGTHLKIINYYVKRKGDSDVKLVPGEGITVPAISDHSEVNRNSTVESNSDMKIEQELPFLNTFIYPRIRDIPSPMTISTTFIDESYSVSHKKKKEKSPHTANMTKFRSLDPQETPEPFPLYSQDHQDDNNNTTVPISSDSTPEVVSSPLPDDHESLLSTEPCDFIKPLYPPTSPKRFQAALALIDLELRCPLVVPVARRLSFF